MEFAELIDKIRSHYVQRLMEAIAAERASSDATVVHEPALRNGSGEIVRAGPLDTPSRIDIVKAKEGEVVDSINVNPANMLSFPQFTLTWPTGEMALTVEPFQWHWLQIQTTATPGSDDWQTLRGWYIKWFGETDPAPDQLSGAVHYFADPQINGANIELTIDLGTSPIEAFEELLDALSAFGAQEVRLGQFADES